MTLWETEFVLRTPGAKKAQRSHTNGESFSFSLQHLKKQPQRINFKLCYSVRGQKKKKILPYFAQTLELPSCDSLQNHTKFQPKPVGRHFHPGISGILNGR